MNKNMEQKPRRSEGHDKLFKVHLIIDALRQNLKLAPPEDKQSIDEQIIPVKGCSQMKQYFKAKPHKWGYKVFTRACSGDCQVKPNCRMSLAVDSELKNQGRSAVDYKLDAKSGVQVVKWLDNKTVQLVSSYAGVQPTDT
ncbi:uncharacterized protein LOC120844388 [Ixodes scapularis]|uniref:uncharacterized protein LOC120844388 n=1 Tax=Ixodes scapularis TaxID=6945 RepID=UPI001A9E1C16|nr:uncharacterized protein LOC120844388 [Ixodes scapularis]